MKATALTAWRSTKDSRTRGDSGKQIEPRSGASHSITADALVVVREDGRCPPASWTPPAWLLPHQPDAARKVASALGAFGVALLCDATGLGKTWTALAVATRYRRPLAVVPAMLREQWVRAARRARIPIGVITHEALSRGGSLPSADLLMVDEAHRFRNAASRRYDRLARGAGRTHLLLITATPVVNHPDDLSALLRLRLATLPADLAPLMVARTVAEAGVSGMPDVAHRQILTGPFHADLVHRVYELTFPSFGRASRELLRRHLLYRLGSSLAAAAETLRRHDRYLERLVTQRMTRGEFRRLVVPDDPQFELPFELVPTTDGTVRAERQRVADLRRLVARRHDAKVARLAELRSAWQEPTVVFTAATATAQAIVRAIGWSRVALVTGRRARIASGPVTVSRALDAFAPGARGARVRDIERAAVLVATDLVSEGLDLQDARRVVHFDLPWTPQRLMQRLGRVARLGASHSDVQVVWFPPPAGLDIPVRLDRKAQTLTAVLRNQRLDGTTTPPDPGPYLVRRVMMLATAAAARRDRRVLGALDQLLPCIRDGLVAGAERELRELLRGNPAAEGLERWLCCWHRVGAADR